MATVPFSIMPQIPTTTQAYQQYLGNQNTYQAQQTGGASFLQALQAALAGADSQNTTLRSQQQNLVGQQVKAPTDYRQELITQGVTDPYQRAALLNSKEGDIAANLQGVQGKLSDLGGTRQQALTTAGNAYNAETQAAQAKAQSAGELFRQLLGNDQSAANQQANQQFQAGQTLQGQQFSASQSKADQAFQAQQNELNRQNQIRQAQIAHANNGNNGPTNLQLADLGAKNPLAALGMVGITREAAPNGGKGFWFYLTDAKGTKTPITVDQAASAIPGIDRNTLLAGSSNINDSPFASAVQTTVSGKKYIDLTPYGANKDSVANWAGQNGIAAISDQKDSSQLQAIDTARLNVQSILQATNGVLPSGVMQRALASPNRKIKDFLQTKDDQNAFNSYEISAVQAMKALTQANVRLTPQAIASASKYIPNRNDTMDEAATKLKKLNNLLDNAEAPLVNRDRSNTSGVETNIQTMSDGSQWKQNADGSYTKQ